MKYEFISLYRSRFRLTKMCRVLNISRSGYYAWRRRGKSRRGLENEKLVRSIRRVHEQSRRIYGSPRITAELRAADVNCSKNRIARLMRENGIRSIIKRKHRSTTCSRHRLPVADNIIGRKFQAERPDRIWLSDITYIRCLHGWLYLTAIMDLFSRRIVGWSLSSNLSTLPVVQTLKRAVAERRPQPGLIFHSDRGVQFADHDFRRLLREHGMKQSMSRKGDCYDNAVMESFFDTLKSEYVSFERFESAEQARRGLFDYIDVFYNHKRIHSSLGYCSPAAFEMDFRKRSAFPSVHFFG